MNKSLLRVDEAAECLSVSRWTIYRWVEEGKLRGAKIGKSSLRIFNESVQHLIRKTEIASDSTWSGPMRHRAP
ncbi:MAG: helix-turn-helix domain-containing protein [Nitrospira sp.]